MSILCSPVIHIVPFIKFHIHMYWRMEANPIRAKSQERNYSFFLLKNDKIYRNKCQRNSHAGSQLELMKLVLTKSNLETTRFFISRKKRCCLIRASVLFL